VTMHVADFDPEGESSMWFNPIIQWLLRSPLHSFVSKNMMLITYTGRKSGKKYTTPVNYLRMIQGEDQFLATISFRKRVWWRNLRGGSLVTVRIRGKDYPATAEIVEDDLNVAKNLSAYIHLYPGLAKYLKVRLEANEQPNDEDVTIAARTRVFIKTRLD
jgi:deazaflavin-dependent oxidoreductase (nitroreductase family)